MFHWNLFSGRRENGGVGAERNWTGSGTGGQIRPLINGSTGQAAVLLGNSNTTAMIPDDLVPDEEFASACGQKTQVGLHE